MIRRSVFVFGALLFLASCSTTKGLSVSDKERLNELQSAMTGSYDSSSQALADPEYYNIALHMEPIWTDQDGYYLYVEQSLASTPAEPYRQRVYKLEAKGKRIISRVYELPEPERFVGGYKDADRFEIISPAALVEREGCAVYLKQDKYGVYRGSTKKDKCKSTLRGATYATSRVSINPSFVQSWDRGFDAADEQVWGAVKGGYLFFKKGDEY